MDTHRKPFPHPHQQVLDALSDPFKQPTGPSQFKVLKHLFVFLQMTGTRNAQKVLNTFNGISVVFRSRLAAQSASNTIYHGVEVGSLHTP